MTSASFYVDIIVIQSDISMETLESLLEFKIKFSRFELAAQYLRDCKGGGAVWSSVV